MVGLLEHYTNGQEVLRLDRSVGQLELMRTQEILMRHLPAAPARVLDVGGGPGRYAVWLAGLGYDVQLLDLVPLHVEQARGAFAGEQLANARADVGDARELPFATATQDVVLLLGPLYHLQSGADRARALAEAARVLRPGGVFCAAAISRYASLLDGFSRALVRDPVFIELMERDLATGAHDNPSDQPDYFTTAYLHHPDELAAELESAGFQGVDVLAVEGPFWCMQRFDELWSDATIRERMLHYLRQLERERSLLGVSAHLLAVGRKRA